MSLQEQLNTAMKDAMRAKDSLRLNTIRMIRTAIKNLSLIHISEPTRPY